MNYELALYAASQGLDVVLVAADVMPELLAVPNISWIEVPYPSWLRTLLADLVFVFINTVRMNSMLKDADIVHVNGFNTWRKADINTAHFVHSAWLKSSMHSWRLKQNLYGAYQWLYTALNSWLEKKAFRKAKMIVAISETIKQQLMDLGIPQDCIRVIHNGVDIDEYKPGVSKREALGFAQADPLLLWAGDLKTPRKNIDTVMKALAAIPNVQLAIVGDSNGSIYPDMARELGLGERVRFLGFRNDLPDIMRSADIFVLPARYEPFGLVILEAMSSGLPVITTACAGCAEIITDTCGIVLADPDDVSALAAAIKSLADHESQRKEMGRQARLIAEKHTWQRMGEDYLRLYDENARR